MFVRRIGPDPIPGESSGANGCPDIWELEDGNFAVIGLTSSHELASMLPENASLNPDETLVVLPRRVLVGAKNNIPSV